MNVGKVIYHVDLPERPAVRTLRDKMQTVDTDSPEVRELKRVWWAIYNTLRVYSFLGESLQPALKDLETLIDACVAGFTVTQ